MCVGEGGGGLADIAAPLRDLVGSTQVYTAERRRPRRIIKTNITPSSETITSLYSTSTMGNDYETTYQDIDTESKAVPCNSVARKQAAAILDDEDE